MNIRPQFGAAFKMKDISHGEVEKLKEAYKEAALAGQDELLPPEPANVVIAMGGWNEPRYFLTDDNNHATIMTTFQRLKSEGTLNYHARLEAIG